MGRDVYWTKITWLQCIMAQDPPYHPSITDESYQMSSDQQITYFILIQVFNY